MTHKYKPGELPAHAQHHGGNLTTLEKTIILLLSCTEQYSISW
jgi:hypothetical protein